VSDLLNRAIDAARSGNHPVARQLLADVLRHEPRNETAWLWMAGVAGDDARRRECLERVLAINPHNQAARRGLGQLQPPPADPTSPSAARPAIEPAPVTRLAPEPTNESIFRLPVVAPAPAVQPTAEPAHAPRPGLPANAPALIAQPTAEPAHAQLFAPPSNTPAVPATSAQAAAIPIAAQSAYQEPDDFPNWHTSNIFEKLVIAVEAVKWPVAALAIVLIMTFVSYNAALEIAAGGHFEIRGRRQLEKHIYAWLITTLGPNGVAVVGVILALAALAWVVFNIHALRQIIAAQHASAGASRIAVPPTPEKPLSLWLVRGTLLSLIVAMASFVGWIALVRR
jgi:hypothetical protein